MAECVAPFPSAGTAPTLPLSNRTTPTLVPTETVQAHHQFSGENAMTHVSRQMDFGPRIAGSDASRSAGRYIIDQLTSFGWKVETQEFNYRSTNLENIIAVKGEGSDIYVVGAHYDTRRRADRDAELPLAPVPGANDGASGVAVLLELADSLDVELVNGQVWLVFFDAEDDGSLDGWDWIIGSRHFVDSLNVLPKYAIVADMVGDSDQNIYLDGNSDPNLRDYLWSIADKLGYGEYFVPVVRYSMLDDHTPFNQAGIPAVDIIDFDYPYWHTTKDTLDKVSAESLERVGRVIEEFLESGGGYTEPAP